MNLALQNRPYKHTLTFIQRYAQYFLLRLGFRAQDFAVLVGKKVNIDKKKVCTRGDSKISSRAKKV